MFDKKTLNYLSSMSDDKLEQMIRLFASGCGADLSRKRLDARTMRGIRAAMSEVTDADTQRAGEIISAYKKGKKC